MAAILQHGSKEECHLQTEAFYLIYFLLFFAKRSLESVERQSLLTDY